MNDYYVKQLIGEQKLQNEYEVKKKLNLNIYRFFDTNYKIFKLVTNLICI